MRRFFAMLFSLPACLWGDDYQPRNTQPGTEEPPTPIEALYQMSLPEGFEATLFAHEPAIRQPIAMTLDDRARLWVIESYSYEEWEERGEDRIVILEDTDGDGRHDKRTLFYDQGKHFAGMALGFGGVWVADAPNVSFIPDRNGDDVPDGPPEVMLTGWTTAAEHNMVNGLQWGPDGWLYGRHGVLQWSKVGVPGTPEKDWLDISCGIWRYHPQSRRLEHVVRGTTNPWGLDWDEYGEMFMSGNVNGHLWHVIPGAYFERMHPTTRTPYVYERLTMAADVPHYAGTGDWKRDWNRGQLGRDAENPLGGGHSHCGAMIYLGHQWPDRYRGVMFMANTHGRRVNVDRLTRRGSSFAGHYEGDFLRANQSWFRGVTLLYGPDGSVYVSDWTDDGECHDHDGVHRTSGRIYKITHGQGEHWQGDLAKASDQALLDYQHHKNEWFARQGRRLFQERAAAGTLTENAVSTARGWLASAPQGKTRLQGLWLLQLMGRLDGEPLIAASHDGDEHVRAWAVRLFRDRPDAFGSAVRERLLEMAESDSSSLVRLYLATVKDQEVILALAAREEDWSDTVLQHMLWYGLEPMLGEQPSLWISHAGKASPWLEGLIARRLFEPPFEEWGTLEAMLETQDVPRLTAILQGYARSLKKHEKEHPFREDAALETILAAAPEEGLALALELGHTATIDRLLALVTDEGRTLEARERDLKALVKVSRPDVDACCLHFVKAGPSALRMVVLPGMAQRTVREWSAWVLSHWNALSAAEKPLAMDALIERREVAQEVGHALADGRLSRQDISASQAQKLVAMLDATLSEQIETHWGSVRQSDDQKRVAMDRYRTLVDSSRRQADLEKGRAVFAQSCGACHQLFGEGGNIGPDLTGSDRGNVSYLLSNIVDPSASVAADYRLTVAIGKDGRVIAGSIIERDQSGFVLRSLTGDARMAKEDLESMTTMKTSLMPEGLLETLTEDQVIDLVGYLQSHVAAP